MNRFEIERAVQRSGLPAPAIAVMMALCTRINRRSGVIEPQHSPSLSGLARMTGFHVATICRHLRRLETDGWLTRDRLDPSQAGRLHRHTLYDLQVPDLFFCPAPSRTARRGPVADDKTASRTARREPVADRNAPSRSPQDKHLRTEVEDNSTTEIVIADDDFAQLAEIVQAELLALTGRHLDAPAATEAARQILTGRTVRDRAAYLRRAIRSDPQRFTPRSALPPSVKDLGRREAEAIAKSKGRND